MELWQHSVAADYTGIRDLRQQTQAALLGFGLESSLSNSVLLCIAELATNFVEHADNALQVEIQLAHQGHHFIVRLSAVSTSNQYQTLRDWLDKDDARDNDDDDTDPFDALRTGGRGHWLVKQSCPNISALPSVRQATSAQAPEAGRWSNGFDMRWPYSQTLKTQILVVEDGEAQNTLFCTYLSATGHAIAAYSVKEALTELHRRHIDIVLCDLEMPDQNGLQLRQILSQQRRFASLPFILTSAHDHQSVRECIRLGIDDFLPKPLQKAQLIQCVERVLSRNHQLHKDLERRIQGGIHASLQPRLPEQLRHWRAGLRHHSNAAGGGDLLVWEQQGDDCFVIVMDVMGHDEAAKFFSHAYLGYIRGFLSAHTQLPDPASFLKQLSHSLYTDHLLSRSLCTCCAIRLGAGGRVEIASAGHPLPWLVTADGIHPLGRGGQLAGLEANIDYTSSVHQLKAGDRLVLFTDGLMDERCAIDGQCHSLQNTLWQNRFSPLDEAAHNTFEVALNQQGMPLDDALLLLLEPIGNG